MTENGENSNDPTAAMMAILTALQTQFNAFGEQLERVERAPRTAPIRNAHPTAPPNPGEEEGGDARDERYLPPERDPQRRAPPRGVAHEEPPPVALPRQTNPDMKLNAPPFSGRVDPDAYLHWEKRMHHIFEYYEYTGPKKVALAVAQFTDHALSWWDREVSERRRSRQRAIDSWLELKELMRRRYVPPYYHRELQKRFRRLTQGSRSVEEYFDEFEHLTNRLELEDTPETLMAQFLDGLHCRSVEYMLFMCLFVYVVMIAR